VLFRGASSPFEVFYRIKNTGYCYSASRCPLAFEEKHATGLEEEGLTLFPVDRGITYKRSIGTVIHEG
jgi:hypothetical protein